MGLLLETFTINRIRYINNHINNVNMIIDYILWGFTLKGRDVVLGLLMEKELSGYDIKIVFEDVFTHF